MEWKEYRQFPVGMSDATAVWQGDKLYVGGGTSAHRRDDARVYIYNPTTDTWDTPIDTPVNGFALTTYRSQLVLVGGREYAGDESYVNKLWTLNKHGQWQETLPPMRTKRQCVCAMSYRDHLLVAGGKTSDGISCIVEVYNGSHWFFTQSLSMGCYNLKSAILDQHWYLMGGFLADDTVHYASLDSLLASCLPSETSQLSSVWKRLTDAPYAYSGVVVLSGTLIAVGGGKGELSPASTVHAYSFHTNSWIHIGDMPFEASNTCSVVLPTGELMVVGGFGGICDIVNVLKATINGNLRL